MIYSYEKACKEAGLSEEETEKLRRFFDAEKKRLRRDKESRKAEGISFCYIQSPGKNDEEPQTQNLDFVDRSFDLEETIMHKLLMEQLHNALAQLSVDDREFLLAVFSGFGGAAKYAKAHGMTKMQVSRKQRLLVDKLREIFFNKN